jgi:copper chaperone CopZ
MLPMAPGPAPAPEAPHDGPEPGAAAERFRVEGMDCAACAQTVERVVAALDGVRAARVSFGNATMTVEGDVAPDRVSAAVARAGYRETPPRENALFNLLSSFAVTFLATRGTTYLLRRRRTVGPFRNLVLGRRHIHHFVPGIVLGFAAGAIAIVSRDEALEPWLAVPFGVGMGLTLDESALLLELEDVYWTREGLLSVQITLSVIAVLASLALGMRFLRRGEQVVLEGTSGPS